MGKPKAWLPFGGEALLQRVVRRVGEAAWPIVVVAAPDQELPLLSPEIRVVRDPVEGRGPLQGIAVGLGAMEGLADAAFISSTDAPFLEPALIRRLAALRAGDSGTFVFNFDIVVPRTDDHHHPLCAVYACSVRPEAEALLAANRPRPFFLFERVRTLIAEAPLLLADPALAAVDPDLRSLRNLNTPDDYEAALREAGISDP
jgi:molybdopterin-guanine dinucleotide biosynthesis protein A